MTAIPEVERVARDAVLLQTKDTVVRGSLSHVTPLKPDDLPIANVPDMTVSLRKHTSTVGSSSPLAGGAIDPRYVLHQCPTFSRKEYQPVETFVSSAITSKDGSSAKPYRAILDAIRKKQDPPLLCKVLLALSSTTLHLLSSNPKQHDHLLHLLFRLDPFLTEENSKLPNLYSLADAHLHLLLALVSANSVFVTPAMNALWRLLTERKQEVPPEHAQRLHALCANIVRLVPKGNSELFPIMAANFPFRLKPCGELVWYTRQCLAVLDYVPTIHSQVLELVLDKCLEMDVEIKIDVGGQVSIEESNHSLGSAEEEMFELELDEHADSGGAANKNKVPMQQDKAEEHVDEMADKLDSLMTILLEHIQDCAKQHGTTYMYRMISPVFDSSILTTHRSKFVQFVVLVLCGLQHRDEASQVQHEVSLDREFAAKLIDIVMDPYRATVTRQSGACYLASFVSRATYVSAETACEAVAALLKWAEAYMDSDYSMRASDLREQCDLHSLFYTVCQAAFYIMCFRGADVMNYYRSALKYHESKGQTDAMSSEEEDYPDPDHVDIGPERWTKICGHGLRPLRFCLESVRGEFLHVASVFQLLPPPLLQRLSADDSKMSTHANRRKSTAITTAATLAKRRMKGGVGGMGRGSNPLDSFFPYDPYLLARSHCFVEPFYKNWEGSIEEEEEEEEDGKLSDDDEQVDDAGSVGDESDVSDNHENDNDDDDDDKEQPSHVPQSVDSSKGVHPMSYVSNATIESASTRSSLQPGTPEAATQKKQEQKEAWSETLKRSRALSIENGSW